MRICIHDFAGHPFQFDLSSALAIRGHDVLHVYCGSHYATPTSVTGDSGEELANLEIRDLQLSEPLNKTSLLKRRQQETEYGRLARSVTWSFRPDVVLSANMPLDAQSQLVDLCQEKTIAFVFWLQDMIGVATHRILQTKLPILGRIVGAWYLHLEKNLLLRSKAVVALTEDFIPILQKWGLAEERVHVVHNWSPIESLPIRPKSNPWSVSHGLADRRCVLYTGTLGLKHNPDLLLQLAVRYRHDDSIRVVVVSQGRGADYLRAEAKRQELANLVVLAYQPFEDIPDVMASADLLVAVLEPDAGVFSVPSKALSYLCASRPILLAVPAENLAARIVTENRAGLTVEPSDTAGFLAAADRLLGDTKLARELSTNARSYAEANFRIEKIAGTFERILSNAVNKR